MTIEIDSLSTGQWYRELLKLFVMTETDSNGFVFNVRSKIEIKNPYLDLEDIWRLSIYKAFNAEEISFSFKLLHNLLPTQENLSKVLARMGTSNICTLCSGQLRGDQLHSFLVCSFNNGVGKWLVGCLNALNPAIGQKQILNFEFFAMEEKYCFPAAWLSLKTLMVIWNHRCLRKSPTHAEVRSSLEAGIMILRKARYEDEAKVIENLITKI